MRPVVYDLTIYRGADYVQWFRLEQPNGTPVDLTGCTITSQIRRAVKDSAPLIEAFTVDMPAPASGQFYLTLSRAKTAAVQWPRGFYDVLITTPADLAAVYIEGRVTFRNTVSKKS